MCQVFFLELGIFSSIHSRSGVVLNVSLNRLAQFEPSLGQVVHLLEVEPELRTVAEEAGKAQGCVRGDRAAAMNDVANARGGDAASHCQRVLRKAERQGLKPGPLFGSLGMTKQAAEKSMNPCEIREIHPAGAKAQLLLSGICGTTEVVP